jgi:hypothetical protein
VPPQLSSILLDLLPVAPRAGIHRVKVNFHRLEGIVSFIFSEYITVIKTVDFLPYVKGKIDD